jgi:hypothetical protein
MEGMGMYQQCIILINQYVLMLVNQSLVQWQLNSTMAIKLW